MNAPDPWSTGRPSLPTRALVEAVVSTVAGFALSTVDQSWSNRWLLLAALVE
ncbi:hypothetical protein [Halomarina ordinaria]|uniref:Uncharacterized protein n=1 Tax=Halomarina ordinaria TaxID=3033939 RepID=A0ABD5UA05_9EURY|nr:hypothetical protein [Halomarina sp. PSRA2]